jgi:hypothetical protein
MAQKIKYSVVGTSKISQYNKITLIEPALKILDVELGDTIVFYIDENNNMVIRGAQHGNP